MLRKSVISWRRLDRCSEIYVISLIIRSIPGARLVFTSHFGRQHQLGPPTTFQHLCAKFCVKPAQPSDKPCAASRLYNLHTPECDMLSLRIFFSLPIFRREYVLRKNSTG